MRLILTICDQLQPQLPENLVARGEERVVLNPFPDYIYPDASIREQREPSPPGGTATAIREGRITEPVSVEIPDLTVPHRYIEILDVEDQRVFTVIEVLSPINKTGDGLIDYRQKQRDVLVSSANLVEIDLLRGGRHAVAIPEKVIKPTAYRVCIHRAGSAHLDWIGVDLRNPLPAFRVPVSDEVADVVLDLQAVLDIAYDAGKYRGDAGYSKQPQPPLASEDWEWSRQLLRERGILPAAG
jgi:hypothetical protein